MTKYFRKTPDVDRQLKELGLSRDGLRKVRRIARHEAAMAGPFHCSNAAGTFSYQHGTWALRKENVGKIWAVDHAGGVESIRSDKLKLRVAFANVDATCDDERKPKPRSEKGAGAERVTSGVLFGDLPESTPQTTGEWAFYYFMLDEQGGTELSWPIIKGGKFVDFVERIYLTDGTEGEDDVFLDDVEGGVAENFDPQVARKRQ